VFKSVDSYPAKLNISLETKHKYFGQKKSKSEVCRLWIKA